MASSRQIGNRSQLAVKKFYEAEGWVMHNQGSAWRRMGSRWFPVGNDIWGAFDLVGIHPNRGFLFVQSKTGGSGIQEAKRRIEALPWPKDTTMMSPAFGNFLHVVVVIVKHHAVRGRPHGVYLRFLRWLGSEWVVENVEMPK
jgi:hypothetical protein